jgi:hypothetical protein
VVLESNPNGKSARNDTITLNRKVYTRGIIAGLLAATGQALGVVLAKKGLSGDFLPFRAM